MATIGYARVSTDGQTLQAQTEALQGVGCARIFAEKISGAHSDRPQLAKAIAALGEGDTLVVCKLDRLARSNRGNKTDELHLARSKATRPCARAMCSASLNLRRNR